MVNCHFSPLSVFAKDEFSPKGGGAAAGGAGVGGGDRRGMRMNPLSKLVYVNGELPLFALEIRVFSPKRTPSEAPVWAEAGVADSADSGVDKGVWMQVCVLSVDSRYISTSNATIHFVCLAGGLTSTGQRGQRQADARRSAGECMRRVYAVYERPPVSVCVRVALLSA